MRLQTICKGQSEFLWYERPTDGSEGILVSRHSGDRLVIDSNVVDRSDVEKFVKHLQAWLETGSLAVPE